MYIQVSRAGLLYLTAHIASGTLDCTSSSLFTVNAKCMGGIQCKEMEQEVEEE